MSDDTELEDRILGTALARAIEARPVRETPFSASRAADALEAPPPRPLWQTLAAAAVVVLGVGLSVAVLRLPRGADRPPAATQPVSTPTPAATVVLASAVPVAVPAVPVTVYFARDGLPPIAASVLGHASTPNTDTPRDHVGNRISALISANPRDIPAGARNAIALAPRPPGTQGSIRTSVTVSGGTATAGATATIDLTFEPPLLARSADDVKAIVQQLVYTATEEPGIDLVRITTNNGKPMLIGGFPVDTTPLSRMDVAGYAIDGLTGTFQFTGTSVPWQLTTSYSVDTVAPGLARFTIAANSAGTAIVPAHSAPSFTITAFDHTTMAGANAELEILVPNGADTTTAAAQIDRAPLRAVAIGSPVTFPAKGYRLGLDHLWPWRAVVLYDPTRIVIDIGGAPSAISADQNDAVYAPAPGAEVGRTFTVSGAARAYEATVSYRVRDDRGNPVVTGFAKATIGTSAVWGGYDATVTLPSSASGNVTLEVFEVSPKDGSEVSKVTIPLRVR